MNRKYLLLCTVLWACMAPDSNKDTPCDTPPCACPSGETWMVDECVETGRCGLESSPCAAEASCRFDGAEHACVCPEGYVGDGFLLGASCSDVDECATGSDNCDAETELCENILGGFDCSCAPGYAVDSSGICQVDDDQCFSSTDNCVANATCNNLLDLEFPEGFSCACNSGYSGDGSSDGLGCVDVNECESGSPCVSEASCQNTTGDFSCLCPSGYEGEGRKSGAGCSDVNECASGSDTCDAVASCSNTVGSYTCSCSSGYAGDGYADGTGCDDVDECFETSAMCVALASCENTVGDYLCTCPDGQTGDGRVDGSGCLSGGIGDLSDDFQGDTLDSSWQRLHPEAVSESVAGGELSLQLDDSVLWFHQSEAVLYYKMVSGNFKATTRLRVRRTSNLAVPPATYVNLAGLMARDPSSDTLAENYLFVVLGYDVNDISVETKNTVDGFSTFEGPSWAGGGDAELRICRFGANFYTFKREFGASTWEEAPVPGNPSSNVFMRPDLPDTLQVGMNIYTASNGDNVDITAFWENFEFAEVDTAGGCTVD